MRKVKFIAIRPEGMEITITAGDEVSHIPVPHLVCDLCNDYIPNGSPAIAITMWDTIQRGNPRELGAGIRRETP